MRIRIIGTDLPGTSDGNTGVHVGVQRGTEVVDAVSADVASVTFDVEVSVVTSADGLDFRGKSVHGRRGERFLYLVWSRQSAGGRAEMFRRAKLQLGPVAELLTASEFAVGGTSDGGTSHGGTSDAGTPIGGTSGSGTVIGAVPNVIGRLSMTDAKGGPICASVRPPAIDWQLA